MRPTSLAALVLLAPLAAGAQTTSNTSTANPLLSISLTSGSLDFGVSACQNNTSIVFSAAYASPVPTNAILAVFLQDSTSACATTAPSGAKTLQLSETNRVLPFTVAAHDVAGSACASNTTDTQKSVCALATVTSTSTTTSTATLTLTYHSAPPPVPTLNGAEGGDTAVHQ